MKAFTEPKVELIEFSDSDIITTSGCNVAEKEFLGTNCGGDKNVTCIDGVSDWQ